MDPKKNPTTQFEWVAEGATPDSIFTSTRDLRFVSETGVKRPQGVLRDIIRSHARRKGPDGRKQSPCTTPTVARDGEDQCSLFDDSDSRSRRRSASSSEFSLTQVPTNNSLDPFHALPISEHGHAQFLVKHYYTMFVHTYSPVIPKEGMLQFSISDSALLHATLLHSVLSISMLRGQSSTSDLLFHQGQAIRFVNERIGDQHNQATSDTTIAAVANLTAFEIHSGSATGIKLHMDGLEAMVKSRGGLQALNSDSLARKITVWTDDCVAIAMKTKPRFKLTQSVDGESRNRGIYSPLALQYETKLSKLTGLPDFNAELIDIYWVLRNLTAIKDEAISPFEDPSSPKLNFSSSITSIECLQRRVIILVQSKYLESPDPVMFIYRLFCNAALIHIIMFIRESPLRLRICPTLSARIKEDMQSTDWQSIQKEFPQMVLWLILMGGLGCIGTDNRQWFTNTLVDTCRASAIRGVNAMEAALSEFLWSDLYRSPITTEFWDAMALAQALDDGRADVE